jgi:hypothetical protein
LRWAEQETGAQAQNRLLEVGVNVISLGNLILAATIVLALLSIHWARRKLGP